MTRLLAGRLPEDVTVMPLHAGVSPAQQRAAIRASASGGRRLVLATSLAESAVTLDGVDLVVDAGWRKTEDTSEDVGGGWVGSTGGGGAGSSGGGRSS